MIAANQLSKSYLDGDGTRVTVLDGLSLEVADGDFVAVTGPSGCGKSTLLQILGGLDVAYEGQVSVAGMALKGLPDRELARFRNTTVGFVFQSFHLVPNLSALENVLLPAYFSPSGCGEQERARAVAALARVGLSQKIDRLPTRLSGGERQRVAIARALFSRPKVLFCDEPTGNLDATTGGEIIALFRELNGEGLTMLVVTHEDRMSDAAKRVLRLRDGKLIAA